MKRIVILISGRGSNMEAIVRACADEGWAAQVSAVISNRADAPGLGLARAHGIATAVVDHKAFASREAFDAELARTIDGFVARYEGRMVNVHPSLLPAFTGLNTHRRAIEAGCKLAGATVHFVTPTLDFGPIIAQAVVPVLPADTPESLSARVLEREHVLYPRAVRWLVHDLLTRNGNLVMHLRGEPQLLR